MAESSLPILKYGLRAEVLDHRVWGVPSNALLITLPGPSRALSSREGLRTVKAVCNCHLPKAIWPRLEAEPESWDEYYREIISPVGLLPEETAVLSTGVDMSNLARGEESFREQWVMAFVSAGVGSNAMQIGRDAAAVYENKGDFEPIGTINVIVITSAGLELPALAASFINITEAKNIALQEMKVKSVYNPERQATGTGTDQIVTVSGTGEACRYVGGHTRLGELMARAVTAATIQAIKNTRGGKGK